MQQSGVAGLGLFETNQEFSIAVEPGMSSFDDPAAWFGVWVAILDEPLFGA